MKHSYLYQILPALLVSCLLIACDNNNSGDDDQKTEVTEEEFQATREQSLARLDDYLDSLNIRKRALTDKMNAMQSGEDTAASGNYEQAIQKLENTRISIREQYGVMQGYDDEDWNNIAKMVRTALAPTDAMVMDTDSSRMTDRNADMEMETDSVE